MDQALTPSGHLELQDLECIGGHPMLSHFPLAFNHWVRCTHKSPWQFIPICLNVVGIKRSKGVKSIFQIQIVTTEKRDVRAQAVNPEKFVGFDGRPEGRKWLPPILQGWISIRIMGIDGLWLIKYTNVYVSATNQMMQLTPNEGWLCKNK